MLISQNLGAITQIQKEKKVENEMKTEIMVVCKGQSFHSKSDCGLLWYQLGEPPKKVTKGSRNYLAEMVVAAGRQLGSGRPEVAAFWVAGGWMLGFFGAVGTHP